MKNLLIAIGAYALWGILPLYWRALESIPSYVILSHRFTFSFITLLVVFCFAKNIRNEFLSDIKLLKDIKTLFKVLICAILIAINWGFYIYSIEIGMATEASLAYFINPLVNVILSIIFLKEKLNIGIIIATIFACCGIILVALSIGSFPPLILILPLSFGFYGLIKKGLSLKSYSSLFLETIIILPFVIFFLIIYILHTKDLNSLLPDTVFSKSILVFVGVLTVAPLLLFGFAVKKLSYITIGFIQYVSPTLNLFIAIFIFKESISLTKILGFVAIWIGLIVFSIFEYKKSSTS